MAEWWNRVYLGSCERMAEIPDGSVHCCVTSPPYYGLRDYGGASGQIGLEPTLAEYIERMGAVFREVRRVLRDDGTAWVNMGDSYAGSWGAQGRGPEPASEFGESSCLQAASIAAHPQRRYTGTVRDAGLKPKDLMGVPWRLALALQADGWWLRDAIVWSKPNPMPSSVTDRCTPSYEMIFMLAKSARYFADMDAVREPLAAATLERINQAKWERGEQAGRERGNGGMKPNGPMHAVVANHRALRTTVNAKDATRTPHEDDPDAFNLAGANLRNVWTIGTTPYSDAHFATFPIEIPSRCIRIGAPPQGIVLDPFLGSGTTAEAAEALGRRWVGYEVNESYLHLIAERTRQRGLFAG